MFGKIIGLTFKIEKHLEASNHRRIRDYLIQIDKIWPDGNYPLDRDLLARARAFLEESGYEIVRDEVRGVIYTSPSGNSYASEEIEMDPVFAELAG